MRTPRCLWFGSTLAAAAFTVSCSTTSGTHVPAGMGPQSGRGAHRSTLLGEFDHVIVIVQENRTLDNLFNGFPGADTVRSGKRYSQTVPLQSTSLEPTADRDHSHAGFVSDYDGGKMDGFDHGSNASAYVYVQQSDVQNYWTLGSRFTLADEVFQMSMSPSYAAHIYLVAAQGGYPWAVDGNEVSKNRPPGCFGSAKVQTIDLRTSFPGDSGQGSACVDMSTLFDLLDERGISWRYYAPNYGLGLNYWSAPDYIQHLAHGSDHANLISPETRILSDIQSGSLPAVSYVMPEVCSADHPESHASDPLGGPHWVAAITNAIGQSSYWSRTLILVTWDDWGGFYDHVPPPIWNSNEVGFRTPLLLVSAYPASPGAVDHTVRNQAAVITAIESIFGLGSLGQMDGQTDDLSNTFNFQQEPVEYGQPLPAATPDAGCKDRK
jgi:phospholipase C